jgi:hypothetical protein
LGDHLAPESVITIDRNAHIRSAIVVRQRFFGIFWPLFLAGSERLRDNRRMTDAGS